MDLSEPAQAVFQERWEYGHTPFRSWCRHSGSGQGLSEYHMKSKETRGERPIVSLDYRYLGKTVNGTDEELPPPVLCCNCSQATALMAAALPSWEVTEWTVPHVVGFISGSHTTRLWSLQTRNIRPRNRSTGCRIVRNRATEQQNEP